VSTVREAFVNAGILKPEVLKEALAEILEWGAATCPNCVTEDQMLMVNDWSEVPESAWTDAGAPFWCTHKFGPGMWEHMLHRMERVETVR
jgi:hypothetical protein